MPVCCSNPSAKTEGRWKIFIPFFTQFLKNVSFYFTETDACYSALNLLCTWLKSVCITFCFVSPYSTHNTIYGSAWCCKLAMCCNILNPGQASNSLHIVTHFLSLIVLAVMTKGLVMAVNWEINYRMQISVGVSGNILFLLNFLTSSATTWVDCSASPQRTYGSTNTATMRQRSASTRESMDPPRRSNR